MNTELKDQYSKFKLIVESDFVELLCKKIDIQVSFLEKVAALQRKVARKDLKADQLVDGFRKTYTYKKALLDIVEPRFELLEKASFDDDFSAFNLHATNYIDSLAENVDLPQSLDRFKVQPDNSALLKFGKWWKRFFYAISKWPEKISNGFRKLFKKQLIPLKPWSHKVKLRNLTSYYLKERLSIELLELFTKLFVAFLRSSKVCWEIDSKIDQAFETFLHSENHIYEVDESLISRIDEAIAKLQKLKTELKEEADTIYEHVFDQYASAYEKAGTIEISNNRFNTRKNRKQHKLLKSQYVTLVSGWNNALFVLSDDWEIDLEIYVIIYSGLEEYYKTQENLKGRLNLVTTHKLNEIKSVLENTRTHLREHDEGQDLRVLIEQELSNLRGELTPVLLPETNNLILAQDFPALVNNLESETDRLIKGISTRRSVMKGVTYDQPIKTSSLSFVSPYELINFESWPYFQKTIKSVKLAIVDSLNDVQNDIIDIGQIAEFNLESALSLFDDEERSDDPAVIAAEGIERTIEKVGTISDNLNGLQRSIDEDLFQGLESFNKSLVKFTNNENIFDIRVRIAKGKALDRSTRFKEQLAHNIKNFLPTALIFIRTRYRKVAGFVKETSKKIGIAGLQKDISTELADFLVETEKSISKLPFVYQRLFRTEPLADINFFEGRKTELLQLNNAYNNWTKGRFASVVITGEKGSGVTTLLNFFLSDLTTGSMVCRFSVENHIETPAEIVSFFAEQFESKFDTFDDLVSFLNQKKRIVVLENIQKFYLKRVNGFGALRLFCELISLTSKYTFWVVGGTRYAWEYLQKTINLAEHFSYLIPLKDFDNQAIVNMINKRHKVSGYNVSFEPAPSDLNQRKFKKLSEAEQQASLRDSYFNNLNKIAKSNVSLALIYWLRSAKEITGNTIVIGSMKDIDFSFMNSLVPLKFYALANLLFHDGMTEEGFCKVTGYTSGKARAVLQPMFEDGIIVIQNNKYQINPLLYRQTVMMLKMKNIIH
ncbi:ATP-binding protein [Fulvivirga sp. 29W222]|uniref:ATP-binding protein n=1 Tax=Fulvivirga marina TaxID=2494733 RepID=A0A937FVW6_9BACT|nr:ATP-binding protein [Fulvivirga marina]MBL6445942.1 ATP-binding protein [Fulvivirga marina]